jgi:hypothetical protein
MPMPNSSTATADSCVFCAPGSAGSSATSGGTLRVRCEGFHRHHQCARSQATRTSGRHSLGHSRGPIRSARSSNASAAGSFIPSTLRKWNASARARPADRGHNAAKPRRVFISGQKRGVFGRIKRELRRRSATEAVIGQMKARPSRPLPSQRSRRRCRQRSSSAPSVTTFASFSHG